MNKAEQIRQQRQVVLRVERALEALRWCLARTLSPSSPYSQGEWTDYHIKSFTEAINQARGHAFHALKVIKELEG